MAGFASLARELPRIGVEPDDSVEIRLEKAIVVGSALSVAVAAALWSATYLAFHEVEAGAVSLAFSAVTLVGLMVYSRTHRHRPFMFFEFLLGMIIPFTHTLSLGGLWNSGAVIIWSLIPPVGSLMFYEPKRARWWWLAFVAVMVAATLLQPVVERPNNLPGWLVRVFFLMNIAGVSSIILVVMSYFIAQKNEAYRLLHLEERKAENLLLNILPKEIAAILKNEERTIADSFEGASILFADLVGFTPLTARMAPVEVVNLLNEIFSHFDALVEKYEVEKIRTIGDSYMVASGVPRPRGDHAQRLACMALDMQAYLQERCEKSDLPLEFRIGINSGPVVGGVIGRKKFVYDVWGDAVNIASRMESHGVAGKIQVTDATRELLKDEFILKRRGTIDVKGRGQMGAWFLLGRCK